MADISVLVDFDMRNMNLKTKLRMTALQLGSLHSANNREALQKRGLPNRRLRMFL